jgi:preprotein translocase subunit SecY
VWLVLGVAPFITASIIMQLLTIMVPKFKTMYHEEGEAGRKQFNQYSRYLSVAIGLVQAMLLLRERR